MVVKKGKSGVSSSSHPKRSSHHIDTELHKLHPRHLRRMIMEIKHAKPEHIYKEKKKSLIKEEIKRLGRWGYFKKLHRLDFEPLSIKVLIVYLIFLGLFNVINLAAGLKEATVVLMGFTITGILAFSIHILMILILIAIAYGIGRRSVWGFDLAIAWFFLGILNSIFSALFLKSFVFEFVRELTLISSISVILINSLVIWYLFAQKKYFFSHFRHKATLELEDKIFVYTIICFWVIVLLIGITLGVKFFKSTTEKTDKLVEELNGKQLFQAMDICKEKSGSEKDLCYVVLVTMQRGNTAVKELGLCDKIVSDFLRFTCARASK